MRPFVVVLWACLAASGCAAAAQRAIARDEALRMLPRFASCPDREPVRLLVGRHCPGGVCGYSCLAGRWDLAPGAVPDEGIPAPGGTLREVEPSCGSGTVDRPGGARGRPAHGRASEGHPRPLGGPRRGRI